MRWFIALITMVAITSLPTSAEASDYRWPSVSSICVDRHNDRYWGVVNAVRVWNQVSAGQPKFRIREHCPWEGSVHIYDVYRWWWPYGGMTYSTVVNGRTVNVRIVMNNASTDRSRLNSVQARRWKRYATGHEFGHALGLHHNSTPGSIMCYCTSYWANNGSLNWADRRNLRQLYL